jgi:hypothetical protein
LPAPHAGGGHPEYVRRHDEPGAPRLAPRLGEDLPSLDRGIELARRREDHSRSINPDLKTDADGRFRLEWLVAGLRYDAGVFNVKEGEDFGIVFDEMVLAPGESRDLGDVRSKPE